MVGAFLTAVEAEAGRSVERIFQELGEDRFRELEADVTARLLREERSVVATGGGWAARPGRVSGLPADSLSVWLQVGPEEAQRAAAAAG